MSAVAYEGDNGYVAIVAEVAIDRTSGRITVTRLAIALRAVVDATGEAGEKALEDHCRERQEQDDQLCPEGEVHAQHCLRWPRDASQA